MNTCFRFVWTSCLLLTAGSVAAGDGTPLHRAVDKLIQAGAGDTPLGPKTSDAEFLRRIYLDLAGRIPTRGEARQFLQSKAGDKRQKLIDELLAGPDYPRRMEEFFHAMLMERRGDNDDWKRFLRAAFENNMPWHEMARAMIRPDADNEQTRGAAYFVTARLVSEGAMAPVDVPGLTRDVGRMLAGVDLGCAQCHDHVNIDDYKQVDFQGLHMVYENVQSRRDVKFPALSEKVMTEPKDFMSVFTQIPRKTPPRVPGGGEIAITTFEKGEEFAVPPDNKTRAPGVPKFSPLGELSQRLASEKNGLFCRNIANRLWFLMMGRGLVEPLDVHHSGNPPTHPELLDLLAREFAKHNFDVKWLLRELAQSDCYQRSSMLPAEGETPPWQSYAVAHEKRVSAEQLFWSTLIATGEIDRQQDASVSAIEKSVADSKPLAEMQKLFIKTFANPPKEPETEFQPTVKGALYVMHDESLLALLAPQEGNLVARLVGQSDEKQLADDLFLSILSRHPTEQDIADVRQFLADKQGNERAIAIGQLAWALFSSTEFCVNH